MAEETMDVYLIEGCRTQPQLAPLTLTPAGLSLTSHVMQRRPGFLGLDLPLAQANTVLDQCRRAGARGSVVAGQYRSAVGWSMEAALEIADRELDRLQGLQSPDIAFEATRFVREEALWWVFCRPSEALIAAGHVPGALFVAIDKLDGHVWTEPAQAGFLQAA